MTLAAIVLLSSTLSHAASLSGTWRIAGQDFSKGQRDGVVVSGDGLRLAAGKTRGTYTSPPSSLSADVDAFDRAVVSWSAWAPKGSAIELSARVRVGSAWKDWMPLARWSQDEARSLGAPDQDFVKVDIDTIKIKGGNTASEIQLQATLISRSGASPVIRSLTAATYMAEGREPFAAQPHAAWGRRPLDVPQRSQGVEAPSIRSRICSPTSLSMVLEYHGIRLATADVAARVHDDGAKIYGNWPFNTAFASASGKLDAYVAKLTSLRQLEDEIAGGRPVIISHRFKKGELSNSPISATDGHVIVVVGFDKDGDVVVNDPASRDQVRRTYKRGEFYKTWLVNGKGIVYLVRPI